MLYLHPDVLEQALQHYQTGCNNDNDDDADDGTVPAAPKTYSPLSCRVTSRNGSALLSRRKPSTSRGSSLGRAASTATLTMGAACSQQCSVQQCGVSSADSAVQTQQCSVQRCGVSSAVSSGAVSAVRCQQCGVSSAVSAVQCQQCGAVSAVQCRQCSVSSEFAMSSSACRPANTPLHAAD